MLGKLLDNKTRMLYLLVSLIGVTVLLAAGMMVKAKLSGEQLSVESEAATQKATEASAVEGVSINISDAHVAELFACKVGDLHDSAAVAKLLNVMDLKDIAGKYAVRIAEKDGVQVLTLTTEMPLKRDAEAVFNANMGKYAQQLLALIPQLDKVEWIYSVETSGGEEQAEGAMDDVAATEALGTSPEDYGKSERAFGKLLATQVK